MRAYYGSRISEHMTKTPEGFLICHNVPIARTGRQDYLPQEIGMEGGRLVSVIRTEEEVFSPQAIASFEGKPVTLEHPPMAVLPENYGMFLKGHAQNVHRGQGEDSDLLLADLFIDDKDLIRQIDEGLREISCGYECEYEQDEQGSVYQRRIRGNHVAVVEAGRAGSRVSIKDSAQAKPTINTNTDKRQKGGTMYMNRKNQPSAIARFFSGWAKDRDPEEVASAVDDLIQGSEEQPKLDEEPAPNFPPKKAAAAPAPTPEEDEEPVGGDAELKDLLRKLIGALEAKNAADEEATDPLEKFAAELQGKKKEEPTVEDQEEEVTVPAEEINKMGEDEDPLETETLGEDDDPEEGEDPLAGKSSKAAVADTIRALKPYLAKLPAKDRRAASDAAVRALRASMGYSRRSSTDSYGTIARMQSQRKTKRPQQDEEAIGRAIMAKYNPHYNKH
ncbi:MAG: DUF2213 domain-containing protein [Clostridia bacterium]|nr:DUF2213 domain-containing protein [Clostridia bacterium]